MRNISIVSASIALVAFTACATAEHVEGVAGGGCVSCHGGKDNQSGAPPFDAHGASSSDAVGAHTTHVNAGIICATCHVDPRNGPAPLHGNGTADVVFGTAAVDPVTLVTPTYDSVAHTCANVYCHAPSSAPGGTTPPPWTAPAGTISGCGACHAAVPANHSGIGSRPCSACHATTITGPAGSPSAHVNRKIDVVAHTDPSWAVADANGVTPHGLQALYVTTTTGIAGCAGCHGSNLDNPIVAGTKIPSCDSCHQPYSRPGATGTDWRTDCTFCHGDRARLVDGSDASGVTSLAYAPPRDVAGQTASNQVGVHRSHLYATSNISDRVACTACHTVPTDLTHVNGTAQVTLANGTYSRPGAAAGTCSSTYCHGNFTGGNAGNTPSWAGAGTQTCSTCHDAPPSTGKHPPVWSPHQSLGCQNCHFDVATTGAIKASGKQLHINGTKNVALSINGTSKVNTTAPYVNGWDSSTKSCNVACHGGVMSW